MTPQEEIEAFVAAANAEAKARGAVELGEPVRELMRGLCRDDRPASIAAVDAILPIVRRKNLSHLDRVKQIYPILRKFLDDAFGRIQ